ncbi:MAG: hypothetical protein JWQ57_460 [Mucilaginibacter sp.]|nr:hypothetical protein [Mucilaginibacter sp.]
MTKTALLSDKKIYIVNKETPKNISAFTILGLLYPQRHRVELYLEGLTYKGHKQLINNTYNGYEYKLILPLKRRENFARVIFNR